MTALEITREAARNLRSATVRSGVLITMIAVFLFAAGFNEAATSRRVLDYHDDLVSQGAYVAQAISIEEEQTAVARSACEALVSHPNVEASGSMTNPGGATRSLTVAPGTLAAEVFVTEGFITVIDPDRGPAPLPGGWVFGEQLADELGVQVADHVQSDDRIEPVAAIVNPSQRLSAGSRCVFNVVPPEGEAELCYAEFDPSVWDQALELLRYTFPNQDEVAVLPRLDQASLVDPLTEFQTRTSRYGPPIVVLAVQLIVIVTTLSRRREYALMSVLAASRWRARAIAFVEQVAILAIASSIAAAALTVHGTYAGSPDTSWGVGYGAVLVGAGGSLVLLPISIWWVVRGSVASLLQE